MTETAWTSAESGLAPEAHIPGLAASVAGWWHRVLVAPLHRALDASLQAGELEGLNAGTLADIGMRRG